MRKGENLKLLAVIIGSVIVLAYALFPYIWLVITSFKDFNEVFKAPPDYLPQHPTLKLYYAVWTGVARHRYDPWPIFIRNSFIISIASALIAIFLACFAAYGFAKLEIPGANAFLMLLLLMQMYPGPSILIPVYLLISALNLLNNPLGVIIVYVALILPMITWMSIGTFRAFPKDLEDSAFIDGCGRLGTFLRVVLPNCKLMLTAMFMFGFLIAWSEYPFALVILRKLQSQTVSVALGAYIREFDVYWNEMAAAAVIVSIPVIVIFLTLQRYMIRGLLSGALRGAA